MEAIGGGGHRTVAGAQVKGRTMEEAQDVVMAALRETLDKIRRLMKMKVILLEDVKKLGKRGTSSKSPKAMAATSSCPVN